MPPELTVLRHCPCFSGQWTLKKEKYLPMAGFEWRTFRFAKNCFFCRVKPLTFQRNSLTFGVIWLLWGTFIYIFAEWTEKWLPATTPGLWEPFVRIFLTLLEKKKLLCYIHVNLQVMICSFGGDLVRTLDFTTYDDAFCFGLLRNSQGFCLKGIYLWRKKIKSLKQK